MQFYICFQVNHDVRVNKHKNYPKTASKTAGTHIFASWLYSTSFASLNTGRTDVAKLALVLRCDASFNWFELN